MLRLRKEKAAVVAELEAKLAAREQEVKKCFIYLVSTINFAIFSHKMPVFYI